MKPTPLEIMPIMNEEQHRRMKTLVKECCNHDNGQCILLDRGDGCVCVQRISYSLICRWFREAVLPLDRELEIALSQRLTEKRCAVCGRILHQCSNRVPNAFVGEKRLSVCEKHVKMCAFRGLETLINQGLQNAFLRGLDVCSWMPDFDL